MSRVGSVLLLVVLCALAVSSRRTFELSKEDLLRLSAIRAQSPSRRAAQLVSKALPEEFDARIAWPGCIHPVLNQGGCGSCWAFASTEVLSDRLCIATHNFTNSKKIDVVLSPQDLLSCEDESLGCTMGSPPDLAWRHLTDYGVKTLECVPYTNGNGGRVPSCTKPGLCANQTCGNNEKYFAANYYHVGSFVEPSAHVESIMRELIEYGPVDTTFDVWSDFDAYSGGVYQHLSGSYEGLHSVKIIGYGTEAGKAYWLVQNSWGSNWGPYKGFFKILRGVDECFVEAAIYAGRAKV